MLADAGISPGVMKPFIILVKNGGDPNAIASSVSGVDGVVGADAPQGPGWRSGGYSLVEAFPAIDGAAPGIQDIINRVNDKLAGDGGDARRHRRRSTATSSTPSTGTSSTCSRFVLLLTLILLTRAFRSIVLPIKAAFLNLISLGAAFGIIVFIFQEGHGSQIWDITATQAIPAWIPLMIFAFLFGLSMDYEVFMLSRIREEYDATGSTDRAIELGLARTGKLVTSAALILMFAFLVLSSSPGYEIKVFAIGLAAGIVFDATVIRALLVPVGDEAARRGELVAAALDAAGALHRPRAAAGDRVRVRADQGASTMAPAERGFRLSSWTVLSSTPSFASSSTTSALGAFLDALPSRARVSEAALPPLLATLHERLGRGLVVLLPEDADARDTAEAIGVVPRRRRGRPAAEPRRLATSRALRRRRTSSASGPARCTSSSAAGSSARPRARSRRDCAPAAARPAPIEVRAGLEPGVDTLAESLALAGYERVERVDDRGQFAVRGGIVDVFPTTGREPLRIEFFGDEIESMRAFSPFTQRALHPVDEATLYPAAERRLDLD